jgi:hypothetical protein
LVHLLDGTHLEKLASDAMRLSTVDEDGWPHGAQLSAGECLVLSPGKFLVAIWSTSHTSRNLRRDGRMSLSLVLDNSILEIRARALLLAENQTSMKLSVFLAEVESVFRHRSAYADLVSGVRFRLHNPEQALARWHEQIDCLRRLAKGG